MTGQGLSHVQNLENGTFHCYYQDEQGSTAYVKGITREIGNLYSYDGFGNILESREDITNRILYTSQQYDQEAGQLLSAGKEDQVYVLMEVQNWEEEDADDQPSETFYQVISCLPDGSQRSVSDKITLPAEAGNITEIHISDVGCVAALCQPDGDDGSIKLLFWDVFEDIYWEKEIGASEGKLFLQGEDMIVFCVDNGRYTLVSYDKSGEYGESTNMDADVFEEAQAVYLQPHGSTGGS